MVKKTIPIIGMACAHCAANVERKLNSLHGVHSATVSLPGRSALVAYDEHLITLEEMKHQISNIGYDLVIEADRSAEEIERNEYKQLQRKTLLSWIFALLCMSISMRWITIGSAYIVQQVAMLLALANIIYCGRQFFTSAYKQLLHGSANMDTLISLSTAIAFMFSVFNTFAGEQVWGSRGIAWHTYFDASVMIITFVLTGRLLEEKAKNSTASSIRQLMGLSPKAARLVQGNIMQEVPLSTIKIGDVLEVHAGEKVPVDGTITWAHSFMQHTGAYVDENMITGEPTPVLKQEGSSVLAGTIVSQGKLQLKAKQVGEHTALAHIIQMVQQAQASKAPVQRIVDKVSLVFVPVVLFLSALTLVLWYIIGGTTVLPQAILSAISVLVIACPCAMGLATPTALMVAIGKAAKHNVLIKDAVALEALRSVNAMVIDKTGTLTIPNKQIDFTKADTLSFEARETLKPHALEAISALQYHEGIEVYIISGDRHDAVKYWAERVGVKQFYSQVLPQDKENLVKQLQHKGKKVMMVGDGINDTQALALANVSIAIGKGTDVAMDVAQVTLMNDDLLSILQMVRLSKKTVSMIRQNLFWAFIYNLICIPLAAGVPYLFGIQFQITPMWASALMAFSSVSVLLNSLRLKFRQNEKKVENLKH